MIYGAPDTYDNDYCQYLNNQNLESCEICEAEGDIFDINGKMFCTECAIEKVSEMLIESENYNSDVLDNEFSKDVIFLLENTVSINQNGCTHKVENFKMLPNKQNSFCPVCGQVFPF